MKTTAPTRGVLSQPASYITTAPRMPRGGGRGGDPGGTAGRPPPELSAGPAPPQAMTQLKTNHRRPADRGVVSGSRPNRRDESIRDLRVDQLSYRDVRSIGARGVGAKNVERGGWREEMGKGEEKSAMQKTDVEMYVNVGM